MVSVDAVSTFQPRFLRPDLVVSRSLSGAPRFALTWLRRAPTIPA